MAAYQDHYHQILANSCAFYSDPQLTDDWGALMRQVEKNDYVFTRYRNCLFFEQHQNLFVSSALVDAFGKELALLVTRER